MRPVRGRGLAPTCLCETREVAVFNAGFPGAARLTGPPDAAQDGRGPPDSGYVCASLGGCVGCTHRNMVTRSP